MDKLEVDEKVSRYEKFLNETLSGDLSKMMTQRESLYEEISHYLQLQTTLQKVQDSKLSENGEPLKTQVDLGCNFFVQAVVDDITKVFVCVGFGFYVEFTYEEAFDFIEKRVGQLNTQVEKLSKEMAKVRAQIRLIREGLRELQGLS